MLVNQRKRRGVRGGCLLYSDRRTLKTGRVGWGEGGYWRRWQFGPDHPRKQLQWYPPIKFLQWAFTQGFFAHSFTSERRAACRRRPSASVDWNHNVHTRGENKHCKSHKSGKTHKKYCGNLLAGTVAKQAGGSWCICSYWSRGVKRGHSGSTISAIHNSIPLRYLENDHIAMHNCFHFQCSARNFADMRLKEEHLRKGKRDL